VRSKTVVEGKAVLSPQADRGLKEVNIRVTCRKSPWGTSDFALQVADKTELEAETDLVEVQVIASLPCQTSGYKNADSLKEAETREGIGCKGQWPCLRLNERLKERNKSFDRKRLR
jgi:hypothetical protein